MDVVVHEYVGVNRDTVSPGADAEFPEIERSVVVGEEHPLAIHTAMDDVHGDTGCSDTSA